MANPSDSMLENAEVARVKGRRGRTYVQEITRDHRVCVQARAIIDEITGVAIERRWVQRFEEVMRARDRLDSEWDCSDESDDEPVWPVGAVKPRPRFRARPGAVKRRQRPGVVKYPGY